MQMKESDEADATASRRMSEINQVPLRFKHVRLRHFVRSYL